MVPFTVLLYDGDNQALFEGPDTWPKSCHTANNATRPASSKQARP